MENKPCRESESVDYVHKSSTHHRQQEDNHLAQWVRNSHYFPPDHEVPIEEWTADELRARMPNESMHHDFCESEFLPITYKTFLKMVFT